MSNDRLQVRRQVSAADTPNIDSAGAVSEFVFAGPVLVRRCGVIVVTAVVSDDTTPLTATLSRRPVVGSSSNAVTLGTFLIAAAGVDPAAGKVVYKDMLITDSDGETPEDYDADTSRARRNEAPNSNLSAPETGVNPLVILPGQSFAMTLGASAEADSGAVYSWVEYEELPFNGGLIDQANISRDVSQLL